MEISGFATCTPYCAGWLALITLWSTPTGKDVLKIYKSKYNVMLYKE